MRRAGMRWCFSMESPRALRKSAAVAIDDLFTQALGLASPWKVVSTNFDADAKSGNQ